MSGAAKPRQHPSVHRKGENLIQWNLRNKVCAYCKTPGARLKCVECKQRTYCDKKCQVKDWRKEHKDQCEKLQQVFVPPPPGWREAAAAATAAAAGGGGVERGASTRDFGHPCPVCMNNEDDAVVDNDSNTIAIELPGMCSACGQMYCGLCNMVGFASRPQNCPSCRARLFLSDEEVYTNTLKLVRDCDGSPKRHTAVAHCILGKMCMAGAGMRQNKADVFKWFTLAAESGHVDARFYLGTLYFTNNAIFQEALCQWRSEEAGTRAPPHTNSETDADAWADFAKGVGYMADAAEAGHCQAKTALKNLRCTFLDSKDELAKLDFEIKDLNIEDTGGSCCDRHAHLYVYKHLCPICLDNEDDAGVDIRHPWGGKPENPMSMCYACGQFYCGDCSTPEKLGRLQTCPTCRAPTRVSDKEQFKRCFKLVHDRSPGRYTLVAMLYLGNYYELGKGVKQSDSDAFKVYSRAADAGNAVALHNLGAMYGKGQGVKQDDVKSFESYQLAASKGDMQSLVHVAVHFFQGKGVARCISRATTLFQIAAEEGSPFALEALVKMQKDFDRFKIGAKRPPLPTHIPGKQMIVVLLTSAASASKYNKKKGLIVATSAGQPVKAGRAAVLLVDEKKPISFKLTNLMLDLESPLNILHQKGNYKLEL